MTDATVTVKIDGLPALAMDLMEYVCAGIAGEVITRNEGRVMLGLAPLPRLRYDRLGPLGDSYL